MGSGAPIAMHAGFARALKAAVIASLAGCAAMESPPPVDRPMTAEEGQALVGRLLPDAVKDRAGWATDAPDWFASRVEARHRSCLQRLRV